MVILVVGLTTGFYPEQSIWKSIHDAIPVLLMIITLEIFSHTIERTGIAKLATIKLLTKTKNPEFISLFFIILVYILSLFINNLAAVLILLPIILLVGDALKLRIQPLLVMIIIASNIAGASTMIGDFPNIVISRYAHASFLDFLKYMGLPLLFLMIATIFLYLWAFPYLKQEKERLLSFEHRYHFNLIRKYFNHVEEITPNFRMVLVIVIFASMVFGFIIVPVDYVFIALIFMATVLLFSNFEDDIFDSVHLSILVWFLSLFIIAGAFANIMKELSALIENIHPSPFLLCVILIVLGTVITALLNAGPSTVLLLPLAISFDDMIPNNFAFWSLSLGVLAGSSLTPIGATAGPVVMAHFRDFYKREFSWKEYLKVSFPIALLLDLGGIIYVYISLIL